VTMQPFTAFDGALLIDKPAGPTSHDIVDVVRHEFGIKKVGHCGTLDPNATGLLILVLGKATKLSEKLMSTDKVYEGAMKLGVTTNTYDADGEVKLTRPIPDLSLIDLRETAQTFVGDQMQLPPMVSAVKKDGVPLYKLARKGIEVERKERFMHVYRFAISAYEDSMAYFDVACTKGAYVRTLAYDLGEKIGCGAHLSSLRRTASGTFNIADACPFEELVKLSTPELADRVIPILKLAGLSA
jgi:tRNA pseudouridine55 synthase